MHTSTPILYNDRSPYTFSHEAEEERNATPALALSEDVIRARGGYSSMCVEICVEIFFLKIVMCCERTGQKTLQKQDGLGHWQNMERR